MIYRIPRKTGHFLNYFNRLSLRKSALSGGLAFGLASRADVIASLIDLAARIEMSL
jgi:hypothetical protein